MTIDYTQPRVPGQPIGSQPPERGWWGRNWKWVVIFGCLTPILLMAGCAAALVFAVFSSIRATDVYEDAVLRAQNDPRVVEALGSPVKVGWWMTGNVSINNERGTADFVLPLNGSRNRGTLRVEASRDGGPWNYSILRVNVRGSDEFIDLLPPLSPEGSTNTTPPADQSAVPSSNP
ncbi:MAG TPA: cytochrome c oxidase assembly factor Coa1 family protein [Thermoanaerobaculia bacterium]